MIEGSSRSTQFIAFAQQLVPAGWSANAIIRASRELGFGIQRASALDIIREIRTPFEIPRPGPFEPSSTVVEPGAPVFKWGELVQETDEWQRFDGPNAILFQNTGDRPDEWLDFVIMPEDQDFDSQRFVVEDDEYVDPDRPGSGYRTTQPMPAGLSPREAARRLDLDPGKIARVIFDRP